VRVGDATTRYWGALFGVDQAAARSAVSRAQSCSRGHVHFLNAPHKQLKTKPLSRAMAEAGFDSQMTERQMR
jgi:hypothetical protein